MVDSVRYTNPEETQIAVSPEGWNMARNSGTWHEEVIQMWLNDGGVIDPYAPYYGVTLQTAKDEKYVKIWSQADTVSNDAEATFISGGSEAQRNVVRMRGKYERILSKKVRGQQTTQAEDDLHDAYDILLDYQDSAYDIADLAKDEVELLNTVDEVFAYDEVSTPAWPVWPV